MPRASSWSDLKVGIAAVVVALASVVAVLRFARIGAVHGATVRLHAATAHAGGLLPGSEVWLHGQKVGVVKGVGFRPPSADTSARVLLTLDVRADAQRLIERDALVDVRAGGSFIGSPVLWIGAGSGRGSVVRNGDTLVAVRGRDVDAVRTEYAGAAREVPVILANVRLLGAQLQSARGTLGALGIEGPRRIAATGANVSSLTTRATQGRGTVGLLLSRGEPTARARHAMALADSIRLLVTSPNTSLGRLRRDSTLLRTVAEAQRELARVQAALVEPRGSAGRLLHDTVLVRQLAVRRAELDALAADVRRNPLRYLTF